MKLTATSDAKSRSSLARTAVLIAAGAMLLMGATVASQSVQAQSRELPRAKVVEQLSVQYAEAQAAVGVTAAGGVIEIFTTKDGSTWTLVLTKPDGTSTVVSAGETWIKRRHGQ